MQEPTGLYGDEDEVTTEEEVETPETEQPEPEVETEKGETPEPEEEPAPVEPPATEKEDRVPVAALQEERRKRQELERRLQELEKPEEPKKDFWEDPESVINSRVSEVEQRLTQRYLTSVEQVTREKYPDYDEKITAFAELVENSPQLYQAMLNAPNPAEYAYRVGKTHLFTKDAPDIDALETKLKSKWEAEERERIRKEIEGEYREKKLQGVPESLSEQTSATAKQTKPEGGPTPLSSVFND